MSSRKKQSPVVAIMYDFDKTLCTKDMQEYTFIPNVGLTPAEFWAESGALSQSFVFRNVSAWQSPFPVILSISESRDVP